MTVSGKLRFAATVAFCLVAFQANQVQSQTVPPIAPTATTQVTPTPASTTVIRPMVGNRGTFRGGR